VAQPLSLLRRPLPRAAAFAAAALGWAALGCASTLPSADEPGSDGAAEQGLHGSRWSWVEASCSDGRLRLEREGFERELNIEVESDAFLLTQETRLDARGCFRTSVVRARMTPETGLFRFEREADVRVQGGESCGPEEAEVADGALRLSGRTLEMVIFRSPFCRGFDVRMVYRRAATEVLAPRQLVGRYLAHFNRRDPERLAGLFAPEGSLEEPFTPTEDGSYLRHEGRSEVRGFYASAFATVPWLGMRLQELRVAPEGREVSVVWEYMDGRLAEPIIGRNLMLLVAGEIYEARIQMVTAGVLAAPGSADDDPPTPSDQPGD